MTPEQMTLPMENFNLLKADLLNVCNLETFLKRRKNCCIREMKMHEQLRVSALNQCASGVCSGKKRLNQRVLSNATRTAINSL